MTYSLTLREPLGRKLTITEMDDNLLYLQSISGGTGGSQGPQGFQGNDGSQGPQGPQGSATGSSNKIPYVIDNISNGDTVNLVYNARNIVDSGTDIDNMTFFFSATPSDGDFVEIKMMHAVTIGPSWSLNGTASMANIGLMGRVVPYVTLSAGQEFSFTYNTNTNTWY